MERNTIFVVYSFPISALSDLEELSLFFNFLDSSTVVSCIYA